MNSTIRMLYESLQFSIPFHSLTGFTCPQYSHCWVSSSLPKQSNALLSVHSADNSIKNKSLQAVLLFVVLPLLVLVTVLALVLEPQAVRVSFQLLVVLTLPSFVDLCIHC